MRTAFASAVALLFLGAGPLAGDRPVIPAEHPGVRALTANMANLLDYALGRSPTVRQQVALLDASDMVVYLAEAFESEPGAPKARLQFMAAAGGRRYVRVSLARWRLSRFERIVMLGHELQHAVEIASAPEVQDSATFCALFRRIGWERTPGRFETDAARQVTERLWAEVHGVEAAPRGQPGGFLGARTR